MWIPRVVSEFILLSKFGDIFYDERDFTVMDKTVLLAKRYGVAVGAHPSLPDRQGFGRREMAIEPVR